MDTNSRAIFLLYSKSFTFSSRSSNNHMADELIILVQVRTESCVLELLVI